MWYNKPGHCSYTLSEHVVHSLLRGTGLIGDPFQDQLPVSKEVRWYNGPGQYKYKQARQGVKSLLRGTGLYGDHFRVKWP